MPDHPATHIADCFVDLVDPRVPQCRRHDLLDIITIAVCAVLSGADTVVDIAAWGRAKQDWLTKWLALPNGIPSHDTVGRVFARLDPTQFQQGFFRLVQGIVAVAPAEPIRPVVAFDGKTVRRSGDRQTAQAPIMSSRLGRPTSGWSWSRRRSPARPTRSAHCPSSCASSA
jgi:hypothetical protein